LCPAGGYESISVALGHDPVAMAEAVIQLVN
jgi:hypothetical protein